MLLSVDSADQREILELAASRSGSSRLSDAPVNAVAYASHDCARHREQVGTLEEDLGVNKIGADQRRRELEVLLASSNELRNHEVVRLETHRVARRDPPARS